jgi:hypothetical protein
VDAAGTLTGVAVAVEVSVAATGGVGRAGVSRLAADAGVATADAVVAVDAVGVRVVVRSWPLVNGMDPDDEGRDVIASTDGICCVLCSCEAWSIAWIIIVDMSDPAGMVDEVPVLEVEGVVVAAAVAVLLVALESRVTWAGILPAGRFCAAVIVAIAEAVVPTVVKLVTVTGVALVEVAGAVGAGVLVFAGVLFCGLEFFPRGVKASGFCGAAGAGVAAVAVVVASVVAACAVARTLVVSETVSRSGERPSRIVAGATMVIERVVGVCVTGTVAAGVVVVVAAGAALPMVAALLLGMVTSALCWSITSEKLCD